MSVLALHIGRSKSWQAHHGVIALAHSAVFLRDIKRTLDQGWMAAPVDDAGAVQEVQAPCDVDCDLAAAAVPPELVIVVRCQGMPQVAALQVQGSRPCGTGWRCAGSGP